MSDEATEISKTEVSKTEMSKERETDVTEAEIIEDNSTQESPTQANTAEEKSWGERLTSADHWLRFVFMVLFGVISGVAGYVITAVVVLQFIWGLITGEGNDKLRSFGSSLSQYIYQILRFLTYNTEEKPFPFSDWPESEKQDD